MIKHLHPPTRDCSHAYAMEYERDYCWCNECGTTWKMLYKDDGSCKTWYPLPIKEMSRGVRLQEVGWGRR